MTGREIKEMLAQMIMVGFKEGEVSEDTPVIRTIRDFSLGGVILYNIELKCFLEAQKKKPDLTRYEAAKTCPKNIISPEQLKTLTFRLHSFSKIPLLISVDQEGGLVSRLGPAAGFSERESPKALGEKDDLLLTARVAGGIARDLQENGINLNLAPVVDLHLNPESLIARNERSFGSNPNLVYRHSRAFILAHRNHGVLTALKHFPGKGSAGKDTHLEMADVTSCYQEQEIYPFSRLIQEGLVDSVMTSHINHRGWDEEYPVTLSSKVLQQMLRGKLGYQGVIISDDLLMGAIVKQFTLEEACVLAVQAGVDILLVSNNSPEGDDPDLFHRVFETLVKAVDQGRISRALIETSHARLMALKKKLCRRVI
ncbi:MAG TPA: glycoside hydrolase family 3 N-terminal domain-containing protein [Thermodesulfobacteriota bacterium]|nr:glycoside hydrolase family 3 N-terminal domain-containing protein [Thermodesulfobacteriota bacterium]